MFIWASTAKLYLLLPPSRYARLLHLDLALDVPVCHTRLAARTPLSTVRSNSIITHRCNPFARAMRVWTSPARERSGCVARRRWTPRAPALLATMVAAMLPRAQSADIMPTLSACRFTMQRILGLFLFELLCELVLRVIYFLVWTEKLEWELLNMSIIRGVYAFLIIPFNSSVLWWGKHGPKGSCTCLRVAKSPLSQPTDTLQRPFLARWGANRVRHPLVLYDVRLLAGHSPTLAHQA